MGFSQLWSVVTGKKNKDSQELSRGRNEQPEPPRHPSKQNGRLARKYQSTSAVPQVQSQPERPEPKLSKRKSGRFSLSRSKSEYFAEDGPRKRRSWYGGLPGVNKEVPDLPPLPRPVNSKTEKTDNRQTTHGGEDQVSALPTAFEKRQSYRRSYLPVNPEESEAIYTGERNFSQTSPSSPSAQRQNAAGYFERRQSQYKTNSTALPPIGMAQTTDQFPQNGPTSPIEKRKSHRLSSFNAALHRTKSTASIKSTTSRKNKRSSWLQSSNPDNDNDTQQNSQQPVPYIPNDVRNNPRNLNRSSSFYWAADISPEKSPTTGPPLVPVYSKDKPYIPPGNPALKRSITNPGPKRASYTPRNAAAGFIASTTLATDEERKIRLRRSQGFAPLDINDESGHGEMTKAQRAEWDRLRNMLVVLEKRQDATERLNKMERKGSGVSGVSALTVSSAEGGDKFANEKALRALEFGVREEDEEAEERGRTRSRGGKGWQAEDDAERLSRWLQEQ